MTVRPLNPMVDTVSNRVIIHNDPNDRHTRPVGPDALRPGGGIHQPRVGGMAQGVAPSGDPAGLALSASALGSAPGM